MASADDRKKRILEHLSRSTGDFIKRSTGNNSERKQKIMDHARRTTG
ncbi:hypothetical protein JOY44_19060 [Phormidium sp. CLA17]|nr:hypothetical protein [Leptolyngbya sp. Cla-17]MBM0743690.1 hypothetical protein [Leptolyngbya sp. Cla-17]